MSETLIFLLNDVLITRLVDRAADHSVLPHHHCNNTTSVHSDGAHAVP